MSYLSLLVTRFLFNHSPHYDRINQNIVNFNLGVVKTIFELYTLIRINISTLGMWGVKA